MGKEVPFAWLSVAAFKRLSPLEKEAYLREVVAHLADRLVVESLPRARARMARAGLRKRG
jgi:hypothetical protein